MSKLFCLSPGLRVLERQMQQPPGYRPRGYGICIIEEMNWKSRGNYSEIVDCVISRMQLEHLKKRVEEIFGEADKEIIFHNMKHRNDFYSLLMGKRAKTLKHTPNYAAAVFLLSADEELWEKVCKNILDTGIYFDRVRLGGVTLEQYILFHAAKPFSEYAIPCIPNFTVIPKDKSGVILDNRMYVTEQNTAALSKEKEDIMKIWIDGVYIGAAYVAAGLVAAYQSPDYLKEVFKKNVDEQLPGVRFDIESGDHALQVRTTMAKEITGYTNDIKSDINRKNFGFVFSSENAVLKDLNIQNIMVYKARNLLTDGKSYEPIYKTQVTTYIQRVMRLATGDFKQEKYCRVFLQQAYQPEKQMDGEKRLH